MPSQSHRREKTGVLLIEDVRFMSDQIMYDTLSEGKRNRYNHVAAVVVVVVVVVLALTHRYNAVRGHRTGSNNSVAENCRRRKINKNRR